MVNKAKKIWLTGFVILVVIMISVGGITRLTRSGLSITEWKPFSGFIPPLTEAHWVEQFELYKKTPEYLQVNAHFELSDYKRIFFWEYLHRVLGRIIFLYVLIPGLVLWRRKQVEFKIVAWLALLVASQGLIGWLMVKSGLNQNPHVSPYMLALHFMSALVVLLVAYYHLSKMRPMIEVNSHSKCNKRLMYLSGILLFIQIFYGSITSGMKAGYAFNTYPLMGGQFFPLGGMIKEPAWINFLENSATVQWMHRWIGIVVFIAFIGFVTSVWKKINKQSRGAFIHLLGVTGSQIVLGVLNIILSVPITLAVIHQLIAVIVVLAYFNIYFRVKMK